MKTIVSKDFKRSLTALKRKNNVYFAEHPKEKVRWVKLVSPDRRSYAIVKLRNPGLSPSGLPTAPCHPSPVREGEDTEPNR